MIQDADHDWEGDDNADDAGCIKDEGRRLGEIAEHVLEEGEGIKMGVIVRVYRHLQKEKIKKLGLSYSNILNTVIVN